jgi:hypothetical protein
LAAVLSLCRKEDAGKAAAADLTLDRVLGAEHFFEAELHVQHAEHLATSESTTNNVVPDTVPFPRCQRGQKPLSLG